jgi:hypothetical protein
MKERRAEGAPTELHAAVPPPMRLHPRFCTHGEAFATFALNSEGDAEFGLRSATRLL